MARELILATVVSAVWLTLCFLGAGASYVAVGELIGWQRLMELEGSLGTIELAGGLTSIGRVSVLFYAGAMILASLPINLYWLKRLRRRERV